MYIGGLDVGTTGCKLSVYNDKGEFIYNSYKEYDVIRKNGEHEIDAEKIFGSVCDVLSDAAKKYPISAVGVTTFGETFVAVDEYDNVLLPSMLYTDPRGHKECEQLCERIGEDRLTQIAGVKPHSMYSLPKIMWIKNNLPDVFKKIRRIMLMEDYIVYKLSGVAQIDYSLAARTMAFDIRKKQWSQEIFDAAGIDISLMSSPVPTGSVAGNIRQELAKKLDISEDTVIVNGAHDQVATAVGAGVLQAGEAVDGTGTVECIVPVFDSIPENKQLYDEGYSVVPYVFDGAYVCYALSFTGGATLKWFRDNFAAKYMGENVYAQLDVSVPDAPTGILILPHFAGAANPYMDTASEAGIIGLTLESSAADIYKALMEGVSYEMMVNVEHLQRFGIDLKRIYATGGGASSDVWLQIKSDVWNRTVVSLSAKEVGSCGTCMLCGVAIGLYKDLYEAKCVFVKEKNTYIPNEENVSVYKKYYGAYTELYRAIRPIVEDLRK